MQNVLSNKKKEYSYIWIYKSLISIFVFWSVHILFCSWMIYYAFNSLESM